MVIGDSLSTCIKGTVKETTGTTNGSIIVGGEIINPGDVIVGDADGLVVVLQDEVADAAKLSQAREDAAAGFIEAYEAGASVIEVSKLEPVLKAKGLIVDI